MSRRVVVFDYGSGNIRSAQRALERVGASVEVTADTTAAADADGLVVPGVGAFGACMGLLREVRGDVAIKARVAQQLPVLGICVGHQVLFESGDEHGSDSAGLGILPGQVTRLQAQVLPHVGWNTVSVSPGSQMFDGLESERFYFVHSYAVHDSPSWQGDPALTATTTHESDRFVSAVETPVVWSTQFHPEKSGEAGLHLLENWVAVL